MLLNALALRSLNQEERDAVVDRLAGLFLEAADVGVKHDDDGRP